MYTFIFRKSDGIHFGTHHPVGSIDDRWAGLLASDGLTPEDCITVESETMQISGTAPTLAKRGSEYVVDFVPNARSARQTRMRNEVIAHFKDQGLSDELIQSFIK
jgi:hypothetical protein